MGGHLINFEEHLKESLQNPEFLEEYLNEALKEKDFKVLLVALRHIAESRTGGITKFAKEVGYSRQTIYKTLSEKGNPTLNNLSTFLDAAGFHLRVEANKPGKKPKRTSKRQLTSA